MKIDSIKLQRVHFMPKELVPGVLYVSEEFSTAGHLCACGCGSKIRTPLGPTEWTFSEGKTGPSLYPSIGNWQIACKSHYWINQGKIIWAKTWTPDQISAGYREEERQRLRYFNKNEQAGNRFPKKLLQWLRDLFFH